MTMNKRINQSLRNLILGLATAGAIGLATPVLADQHGRMLDRLDHKLELNEQQGEQIGNLIAAHRDQMREMRESGDGKRGEARGQWRESRTALHEEIRELLSAEQAETFDAMHERKGRKHRRGDRSQRGHGMQSLDLSDEQRQAMRELMREHRGDREAVREGMREILDDEQLARLEEMHRKHGGQERKQRRRHHDRNG
jgi:Spy/CpxP family protein refolding chaperone